MSRPRDWRLVAERYAANCEFCGLLIEPRADRYADQVTGHLVRHVECHRSALQDQDHRGLQP